MKKIKILAIAPYEGLRELIITVAKEYPEIEVQVVLGDLLEGVIAAEEKKSEEYDVIISRGGTMTLLSKKFNQPIINIEVSGYDFLRVIRLAQSYLGEIAIVGFPSITHGASIVCELLQTNIDIFTINNEEDVEDTLLQLQKNHYVVVIGDNVTVKAAKRVGLNGILATSNKESVQKAFQEAIKMYRYLEYTKERQYLFEELIKLNRGNIIVYSNNNKVEYTSLSKAVTITWENKLFRYIDLVLKSKQIKALIIKDGDIYKIEGKSLYMTDSKKNYAAFLIQKISSNPDNAIKGIILKQGNENMQPPLAIFINNSDKTMHNIIKKAKDYSNNENPVLISGCSGTGKETLAHAIHMNSTKKLYPFVTVDCAVLENEIIEYFFEKNIDMLFPGTPSTIYIKSINYLGSEAQKGLLRLLDNNHCRFILSSEVNIELLVRKGEFNNALYEKIRKQSLCLPMLSERGNDISNLAVLFISEANTKYGKQVIAFEENALVFLQEYDWKYNISQLKDMIFMLVAESKGPYIREKDIAKISAELGWGKDKAGELRLGTDKTLDEFEKEIIKIVLREEKYNQSNAAKRLGISRSTMWRKLK